MEIEQHEGSAAAGAPPADRAFRPGVVKRLASVRLTIWILALLGVAMAVATIIPQRAPTAVYERAFGTVFGSLIYKTTLHNIYGSWWFIGAFALLAVNLFACSLRQMERLRRQGKERSREVSLAEVRAREHQASWRLALAPEAAAAAVSSALHRQGYTVKEAASKDAKQHALVGKRGTLMEWAPFLVHVGMLLVLLGAAYGRFPLNSYQAIAPLAAGESFMVEEGADDFAVKLLEAGQEQDAEGRPTRYWARAEIIEHDKVVKSAVIEPNHPLIHRGVNIVLHSLSRGGYSVEVSQDECCKGLVPIVFTDDGGVSMFDTIQRLEQPPWLAFVHDFRHLSESGVERPAARVFIDRSGELSHDWEPVGWVDETGLEYSGVHFRLISQSQGAQLSLDRDIGVPIVWLGFIVLTLGGLLLISTVRRSLVAIVRTKGGGSQVLIGGSGAGAARDLERAGSRLKAEVEGAVEDPEARKEP